MLPYATIHDRMSLHNKLNYLSSSDTTMDTLYPVCPIVCNMLMPSLSESFLSWWLTSLAIPCRCSQCPASRISHSEWAAPWCRVGLHGPGTPPWPWCQPWPLWPSLTSSSWWTHHAHAYLAPDHTIHKPHFISLFNYIWYTKRHISLILIKGCTKNNHWRCWKFKW